MSSSDDGVIVFRYDKSVDAAYISLKEIANGEVADTYICENLPKTVRAEMINLDFDKNGILLGIEILDASKTLPKELFESKN